MVPVFRVEGGGWARVRVPMQQNGVVKGEDGFQVTFRHVFVEGARHYFAFTYPWACEENDQMV